MSTPFDDIGFDIAECEIIMPTTKTLAGQDKPVGWGQRNGLSEEAIANGRRVVVRHVPTGLQAEESRWDAFHNKEAATAVLKQLVEAFILEKKNEWLASNPQPAETVEKPRRGK